MSSKQRPQNQEDGDASDSSKETRRDRSSLPFEPKRKKTGSSAPKTSVPRTSSSKVATPATPSKSGSSSDIPEEVNRRMLRRMAAFCGIPTSLGILTFFVSYFITTRDLFTLPPTAVLLVSLGFFGLGVVGLSYGAISASWDEADSGSVLGLSEFRTNFSRLRGAWQEAGEQKRQGKGS